MDWGTAISLLAVLLLAAPAPSHGDVALPGDLSPVAYVLEINPYQSMSTFDGTVQITVVPSKATVNVTLHKDAEVSVEKVSVEDAATNRSLSVASRDTSVTDLLTITLSESLQTGSQYRVSISFSGTIGSLQSSTQKYNGFYSIEYTGDSEINHYILGTHFTPNFARKVFPCFDEPQYVATFDITVSRTSDQTTLANTMLTGSQGPDPSFQNRTRDTFAQTPAIAPYQVAILVIDSDFIQTQTTVENVNLYARSLQSANTAFAKDLIPSLLTALESYTGQDFPLQNLNLVAVPNYMVPFEHFYGTLVFREGYLLLSNETSAKFEFIIASAIARELALTWFGNTIHLDSWADAWLTEGLVEYLQYVILDKATNGKYDAMSRIGADDVHKGLLDDAEETTKALDSGDYANAQQQLTGLKLTKGAGLFHMLSSLLGDAAFQKGLQQYISASKNAAASSTNLIKALQDAVDGALPASVTVQSVVNSWITTPGYPLLTVTGAAEAVTVTQSRFLSHTDTGVAAEQWIVPFTVRAANDSTSKTFANILNGQNSADVSLQGVGSGDAYVLNWGQSGFYRVNYDKANWQALVTSMSGLDTASRAALIDDAFALSQAGLLDVLTPLKLLENNLPAEASPAPWLAAYRAINKWRTLLRAEPEADKLFTLYVREIILNTAYAGVGWDANDDDSVNYKTVRGFVTELACAFEGIDCQRTALTVYIAHGEEGNYLGDVSGDLLAAVVCEGLRAIPVGSNVTAAQSIYLYVEDESRKQSAIRGMGCSYDTSLTTSAVIDNFFTYEYYADMVLLFEALTDYSRNGVTDVIGYLKTYYSQLHNRIGDDKTNAIIKYVIERISTEEQLNSMNGFLGDHGLNVSSPALVNAMLDAKQNVEWVQQTALPQIKAYARKQLGLPVEGSKPTPPPQPIPGPLSTPLPPAQPPAPGPSDPPGVEDAWHLPTTLQPQHYQLSIAPYIQEASPDSSFNGTVTITLLVLTATDSIRMHAAASLDVEVLSVLDSTGSEVASSYSSTRDADKEFLTIPLPSTLTLGSVYTVSLHFQGQLLKDNEGFYLSSYSLVNDTLGSSVTKFIATTQFEPTWARKAFPCFDEPRFKATFDITVGKLKSQSAISNMPVKTTATDPQDASRDLVTFETTPPMSSYLVAFVVSELKQVQTTDKRISVYVREDAVDQVALVVDLAPQILQTLEEYTGIEYALPKLDLVAIPDFEAGAMENWGCITFRENRMLVATSGEAPDRERSVAEVVAHEFTHLWFGDLVTVAEWSSLWQQEGMASLFQRYILDKATDGKYSALSWLEVEEVQDALAVDALENAEPLTNTSLTSPTALNDHMGTITYSKGAGFLHMIMDFIGESTFRKGLQKYLTENQYGWGTPENLGSALQEAVTEDNVNLNGVTMAGFITSWTEKPGYPLITVYQDPVNNKITISQRRYLQHEAFDPSASKSTWIVPITFRITDGSSSGTVLTTVLSESGENYTQTTADITRDTYILVNENQAGFYRVNYDSRTWLVLAQALSQRQVAQPALRAAILDDVLTLARAGEVESWVAFFVMQNILQVETEPLVWITAKKHMLHYAALCTNNREMRSFFNTYLEQVVTAQTYSELGWTSPWAFQDESQDLRYARGLVSQLGCFADGILCTGPAYVDFINWRTSPTSLRPEMLSAALCTGLANSEVDDVVNAITAYTTATDRSQRFAYVYGFGCIKDNTKITSLLDSVITGVGVEPQEVNDLLISIIANSDNGVEFPLAYLTDRFPKIVSSKGLEYAAQLLQVIAERAYLPSQVAKIEYLDSQYPSLDLVVAVRSAEQSVRWASGSADFAEWIATQIGTDTSPVPAPQHTPTGPYGLPDSVSPKDYTIMFSVATENSTDYGEQYISASVDILVSVTEDTSSVTMHAASNLVLGNITVTDSQAHKVAVTSTYVDAAYEQVTLYLDSSLQAGQQYTISILFDIEQTADSNRAQPINSYQTLQLFDFSMGNARRLVPCFDEPRFRSTFTVSVSLNSAVSASCSPIATTSNDGMAETDTFRTTSPIPIQSLGVFVDEVGSYKSSEVDVTFYGTATSIGQEQLVSRALGAVFTYLEAVTGKGSDLQGLNLVSDAGISYQGNSFWGLYAFSDNIFNLADASTSSLSYKTWYTTVTKDLAQHWFGGLVAMDWWNNPWFGSGFSSYFSYLVGTELDMAWQFDILFVLEPLAAALREDAYESAQPLTLQDVEPTADAIYSSYKGNARNKGAAFVNSLMHIVGPDNVKGLKQFFMENSYSATNPSKLFSTLEKNIVASNNVLPKGVSLEEVVKTWTDQPGYPVVTVIRDYQTGYLSFSQERFLAHTPSTGVDTTGSWWVPLSFTVGPDEYDTYARDLVIQGWIGPNTTSTASLDSQATQITYTIFNTGRADLYRANYDYWNWLTMAIDMADTADGYASQTPRMARPVVVQDALALARVGRLEYILALKVVDFIRVSTYVDAWVAAREVFNDDLAPFLLETAGEAPYKFWVYGMLYTIVRTVGYSSKPSDAPLDTLLRSVVTVWCVETGDDEVVALALEGYNKWFNNTNSVATDTLAASMCAGAMNATSQDVKTVFTSFTSGDETDPTRRKAIIEGMGCVSSATVAEYFLQLTSGHSAYFSGDEAAQVFKSVTRFGPSKVTLALTFIRDNWKSIISRSGRDNLVSALVNIAVRTTTQAQYDLLNTIVTALGSPSNLKSSLLLAKDNLGWQDTYLELVTNWLIILGDSEFPDNTGTTTSTPSGSTISGNPPTNPPTEPVSPFTLPSVPSTPTPTLSPLTQPTMSPQPTNSPQPTTAKPSAAPALAATASLASLLAVSVLLGLAV